MKVLNAAVTPQLKPPQLLEIALLTCKQRCKYFLAMQLDFFFIADA